MLVEFIVSPVADPFSVRVSGNTGVLPASARSRTLKISSLVLALESAGVPQWTAGELLEAITRADMNREAVTRTLEMSQSEFGKLMDYSESSPRTVDNETERES